MSTNDASSVDIIGAARLNDDFRREVFTGPRAQVVVMAIPPGGEIGEEVHPATDQVLLFVDGCAEARLGDESFDVHADDLVFVRAGTRHNFVYTGQDDLRLLTVYASPEHAPGTVHRTKAEADAAEGGSAPKTGDRRPVEQGTARDSVVGGQSTKE